MPAPEHTSKDVYDYVTWQCWHYEPEDRLTFPDIVILLNSIITVKLTWSPKLLSTDLTYFVIVFFISHWSWLNTVQHKTLAGQNFGGFGTARKLAEKILAADHAINSSLLELTTFGGLLIVRQICQVLSRQSFVLYGTIDTMVRFSFLHIYYHSHSVWRD